MLVVQPVIRALQKVRESSHIYQTGVDSVGFTIFKAQQTAVTRPTNVPLNVWRYEGAEYTNQS